MYSVPRAFVSSFAFSVGMVIWFFFVVRWPLLASVIASIFSGLGFGFSFEAWISKQQNKP